MDGDFNVGIYNSQDLMKYISEKRDSGIYLSGNVEIEKLNAIR